MNAGFYMGYNMTNAPKTDQWWHVVQFNHNDYYFVQIAIAFTSQTCEMYKRVAINHSWKSWLSFSPGTATAAQVLSGYTFSSANGSNLSGTMTNRGTLNWSGSNTTYSVPAGYYSGGTLDSRTSYNNGVTAADNRANTNSTNYKTGYNAGVAAGKSSQTSIVTTDNSTRRSKSFSVVNGGYYIFINVLAEITVQSGGTVLRYDKNCSGTKDKIGATYMIVKATSTTITTKNENCAIRIA